MLSPTTGASGRRPAPSLPGLEAAAAAFSSLERMRSTPRVALVLAPLFVLLLLPSSWHPNEYHYFMLALRRVAPEGFSPFSAAFDSSNARVLSEILIGSVVHGLGYEATHAVLRLAMAGLYAWSLAWCLTGFGRSALEAVLILAAFVLLGPDLMGREWLFQGVESKTFAYALVFLGFGLLRRDRRRAAVVALAAATWLHFLIGGFWLLALLGLAGLERRELRATLRLLARYALFVSPLVAILIADHGLAAAATAVPAHGMSADYIYSILRAPHHVAPFASAEQLAGWQNGIVATVALALAFGLLARSAGPARRPFVVWVALLLGYLILALGLSWLDRETGHLGKFYLFRPSAMTLLFAILAAVLLYGSEVVPKVPRAVGARRAAAFLVVALALWDVGGEKLRELRSAPPEDLARVIAFLQKVAAPDDVVLVQPLDEMRYPDVALPLLLGRPTLVSVKFTPTTPADIYRWYDLLRLRHRIVEGDCGAAAGLPVRWLLVSRPAEQPAPPACGSLVWRSPTFAVFALDGGDGAAASGRPASG